MHHTACRPSSLFASKDDPAFIAWGSIEWILQRDDADGSITGIDCRLEVRNVKGSGQFDAATIKAQVLRFYLRGVSDVGNITCDLPSALLATAFRRSLLPLDLSTPELLRASQLTRFKVAPNHAALPIFCGATPKGASLDMQLPLKADTAAEWFSHAVDAVGLRGKYIPSPSIDPMIQGR